MPKKRVLTPPGAAQPAAGKGVRRARASSPGARAYHGPDRSRAIYMAGEGHSAAEIATAIGGTTAARIRAMLRIHGIKLPRRTANEEVAALRWPKHVGEALRAAADARDLPPEELAVQALGALLAEPVVLANLLDHEA